MNNPIPEPAAVFRHVSQLYIFKSPANWGSGVCNVMIIRNRSAGAINGKRVNHEEALSQVTNDAR